MKTIYYSFIFKGVITMILCMVCVSMNGQRFISNGVSRVLRQQPTQMQQNTWQGKKVLMQHTQNRDVKGFFENNQHKDTTGYTSPILILHDPYIKNKLKESSAIPVSPTILYLNGVKKLSERDTIAAVNLFTQAAQVDYADAQYQLGKGLIDGTFGKKDEKTGLAWLLKAAAQKHADASFLIGVYYYKGDCGLKKDSLTALKWFEKSAEEGAFGGQADAADLNFIAGDTLKAIKYWKMVHDHKPPLLYGEIKQIWANAAYNLGYVSYLGTSIPRDPKTAIAYYIEAAQAGHAYANYLMGVLYQDGSEYTPQNDSIACRYYKAAAQLGDVEGLAAYGDCCMLGRGMECDSVSAIYWYEQAAKNGHIEAMHVLPFYYFNNQDNDKTIQWGVRPEICDSADVQYNVGAAYWNKEEYDMAELWWKKAASQNNPDAFWMLYCLYDCIQNDSVAAFECLTKAFEFQLPEAISDMGYCYLTGSMVQQDIEKGRELFRQASSMGNGLAFFNLGISYSDKKYIKKPNWELASDYFCKGAEQDDGFSQYQYGCCLQKGKGVKKDKKAAIHWFTLAAQNGSEEAKSQLKKMKVDISK